MPHIVIDARAMDSTTGRYMRKLVENLSLIDSKNDYTVLVWPKTDIKSLKVSDNFKFQIADYPINGSIREQLGLLRKINRLKPDLVHFGMTQQPIFYRGKKITTIHDLTQLRFINHSVSKHVFKAKQSVYGRMITRIARTSQAIIVPTQYVKQDVAQYANISPDKIFVTYEAADKIGPVAQAIPRLNGRQFIMYVGRGTPHKNLRRLVESFTLLKKKYPQLMLALAGQLDANYRHLERYVTSKRMADSIVFTDKVSEGELKWMYMNTAAYVFPSLSEGFGLPGLEAMIHGAPVVSSKATSLPEVYGNAAHYFDPTSTNDMAIKINDVLSSAGLRAQLIKRGQAQAAKYSWKRMAQQTLILYDKALYS